MSTSATDLLAYLQARAVRHVDLLKRWSAINSGTYHTAGLRAMEGELCDAFLSALHPDESTVQDLPPAESIDAGGNAVLAPLGRVLRFLKRPNAARRVLLCIHYDTVFPADSPFQHPRELDANTLNGPGVNDAKGGIVVMLAALEAFEQARVESSRPGEELGWEVLLNPDEEIGSPGSAGLLREAAQRNHVGLLFEPALPDGSLVGARKGSGNYTIVVRGRAAHAGRDFGSGRSATVALAELIGRLDALNREMPGVTVNCGKIDGGGAVNVVPDLAIGRFNVRVGEARQSDELDRAIRGVVAAFADRDGIRASLHGGIHSPPKVVDERSQRLFDIALDCGRALGLDLAIKPSGGTCDGNKLSSAGLPVIDTLGPVGGEIHSDREFVKLDTIPQRAALTAHLLQRLAAGTPG